MQTDNIAARIGRWSVQHRKKAILGWLAFVFVAVVVGFNVLPQKEIDPKAAGPGESGQAGKLVDDAFEDKAAEQVLVQSDQLSAGDPRFKAAVADVTERLERADGVDEVVGPYESEGQVSKDGHSALVTFELPGESKTTKVSVVGALAAVDAAQRAHPELRIEETGDASITKATLDQSNEEMGKSALLTLPVALPPLVGNDPQSRRAEVGQRGVVEGEEHLAERRVPGRARGRDGAHDLVPGELLVLLGLRHGAEHAPDELGGGRVAARVDPDRHRVDEHADQLLRGGEPPVGHPGADQQVGRAARARSLCGERGEHDREGGRALVARHRPHLLGQRGRNAQRDLPTPA